LEERGIEVDLHGVGRKGIQYFKYIGRELASARDDVGDRPTASHAVEIMEPLIESFAKGELDGVEVVFAKFITPLSTPPRLMPILPIKSPGEWESEDQPTVEDSASGTANYILRPSAEEIVGAVLPLYVRNAFYRALVETAASEQGARRTAMKNATDNAGDILDRLRRSYNRARQAQITQELAEIVGGAEALSG
jgi:F-type H+-transporting ATPase subunit gamma